VSFSGFSRTVAIYGLSFQIETQTLDGYGKNLLELVYSTYETKKEQLAPPGQIEIEHHAGTFLKIYKASQTRKYIRIVMIRFPQRLGPGAR
jgi:hypothetical protein